MTNSVRETAHGMRRPAALAFSAVTMGVIYFLLPLHVLGRHRPVLSWLVLVCALVVVALGLLVEIQSVITGRGGTRPAWTIAGLMCLSVCVFSAAYFVLAQQPHEFVGLRTRVDALYFTVVTLATIGYGDISPSGQAARALTLIQVLYSFVFLTAAATALSRQVRVRLLRHRGPRSERDGG
ncbi:potassium channel family protein [Streptomyces sp. NPDC091272]|uniref:potassium channel family protein n=1 Tax=Streptomyces sp. NPDC091272 TaxID=3365981 RepID=UPI0038294386